VKRDLCELGEYTKSIREADCGVSEHLRERVARFELELFRVGHPLTQVVL